MVLWALNEEPSHGAVSVPFVVMDTCRHDATDDLRKSSRLSIKANKQHRLFIPCTPKNVAMFNLLLSNMNKYSKTKLSRLLINHMKLYVRNTRVSYVNLGLARCVLWINKRIFNTQY